MSAATPSVEASHPQAVPASRRPWALSAWAVIACVLLAASGGVRTIQDQRHAAERSYRETCPFDLDLIPSRLGEWQLVKGSDRPLDALTMRITGGTDHKIRTYANELTGVSVVLLVLFGPAEPVLPHVPAVCYPANGFTRGDSETVRTIDYPLGTLDAEGRPVLGHATFQAASYSKPAGRSMLREAVYHSFRLDGEWSPFIGNGRKFPRRNPGVFKLQIQRQVADGEFVGQGDPIEQFLIALLPEIESRIKPTAPTPLASR